MNGVQQAKTKETKKREIYRAEDCTHCKRYSGLGVGCSFESSTHYFLVSNLRGRAVGEIKFDENFCANTKYEH